MMDRPEDFKKNKFRSIAPLWICLLAVFSGLYFVTAQPGACWQDSGDHQLRIVRADYEGERGLALAHPLFIAAGQLCKLVPFGDPTTRFNRMSGLAMAVALANLAVLVSLITGRRWIGAAAAAMLAVMHTPWWLATITETYTMNAAMFTAELIAFVLLLRSPGPLRAAALFLICGLSLCVHNLSLLALPVYVISLLVIVRRRRLSRAALGICALAYVAGASPYFFMVVDSALRSGNFPGALQSALFGRYGAEVAGIADKWRFFKVNAGLAALNFVSLILPLALFGWTKMRQRLGTQLAASLWAITAIEMLFVARYPVPDQFSFLLPSLVMIAIAAGVGVAAIAEKSGRWRAWMIAVCALSIMLPPATYANISNIISLVGMDGLRVPRRPFRDEIRYWMVPWKQDEDSAQRFARAALNEAAPDGMIVCDSTDYPPLILTRRSSGRAGDVEMLRFWEVKKRCLEYPRYLQGVLAERAVFSTSDGHVFYTDETAGNIRMEKNPDGLLYRVMWVENERK